MAEDIELNHHNDPSGLLRSLKAAGDRPSLGDIEVVDAILRKLAHDVLDRFESVGHGHLTPEDASTSDQAECLRLADVFSGDDKAFAPVPGWSGYGLAQYIRSAMSDTVQAGEDDHSVIAQAFAVFVHRLYALLSASADQASEKPLVDGINENIRAFSWILIGLEAQHD